MAFLLSLLGLVLAVHAYEDYSKPLAVQLLDSSAAKVVKAEIESGWEEALLEKNPKKPSSYLGSHTQGTLAKVLDPALTSPSKGPSDLTKSLQKPMMHSGKYFRLGFLKVGTYIGLPALDNKISNKFLHPTLYDVLPFAQNKLPQLLVSFGLRQDSKFGNVMKRTLQVCNNKNVPSSVEIIKCAISTEEVIGIASMLLHDEIVACNAKSTSDCNLKSLALSTSHDSYEIVKITDIQLVANSTVACHPLPFPYTVYGCHKIYETKLFQVIMQGSAGRVISPVLCHMKTEAFRSSHPAFKALNTTAGDGEICHWVYSRAMAVYV